jgi:hypothetical protein
MTRTLALFLCVAALLTSLGGCRDLYNDVVLDSVEHGLPCDQLPPAETVEQLIEDHRDTVDAILAVHPGHVFFDVDRDSCPGQADILISYASHADRSRIEAILGDGTFFGVPLRLHNQ